MTTNQMCVKNVLLVAGGTANSVQEYSVEGSSFDPEGKINGFEALIENGRLHSNVLTLCQSMTLCNESKLIVDKGRVQTSGLPTEAALKVFVEKIGAYDPTFNRRPVLEAVEQYNDFVGRDFTK